MKQRAETGDYGPTESGMFEIGYLHKLIRDIPKPVIAAVNGVAVGGGHVLHVLCDLSIASETARFGQAGPRVGSFDAGFGSAYLARVVGEKRAREIWYLCRPYDAATAERWGLVNAVVPADRLLEEVQGLGRRDRWRRARPRSGSSSSRSTPTPIIRPACPTWRCPRWTCSPRPRKGWKAPRPSPRSASPTSPGT